MPHKAIHAGLATLACTLSLVAATAAAPAAAGASERPRALATIGMIGDVASEIAGPCLEVTTMIGPGSDPHLYRATPSDIRALDQADLILYLGLGLEGQLATVLERLGARKRVSGLGAHIPPEALLTEDDAVDPHLWMAPALWSGIVTPLADALAETAPDCAADIAARAAHYSALLEALDGWVHDSVRSLPQSRRLLITAHDAFGYFGAAYGLELAAIQGLSTESEASIADIAETARIAAEADIPVIFVESTISPRTVEATIAAAAKLGHSLGIGAELHADAMGAAGTPEGTYIGMIHANTRAIVTALGGIPAPLPEALAPWARQVGLAE